MVERGGQRADEAVYRYVELTGLTKADRKIAIKAVKGLIRHRGQQNRNPQIA